QKFDDEAHRAFRRLQRDIAGIAVSHDYIDGAFADVVAFDEAMELHGKTGITQHLRGVLHLLCAFDFFLTDIEKTDSRAFEAENDTRKGLAHDGELDQLERIRPDGCAEIEHDALAAGSRPQGGERGTFDIRHRLEN